MTGRSKQDHGFTLVEVLTVVFIVALMAGGVILLVPPPDRAIDQEAARLELTVQSLSDRAVLTGLAQGIRISQTGYQAVQYEQGRWVQLRRFGREFPREVRIETFESREEGRPQHIFDPLGVPAEGIVRLSAGSEVVEVALNRGATP